MIVVRTKTGLAWTVLTLDRLEVTTPEGGTVAFGVGDISEVIVDTRAGELAILDGRSPSDGAELRALQVKDAETDIPVRVMFPLETAQAIGEKLHESRLWTPPSLS